MDSQITPEELLYITNYENDCNNVRISVDTFTKSVEIESSPEITFAWANHENKLIQHELDHNSYEITLEDYMKFYFNDSACLDLAKFCVKYHPETTIKSII